MESLSYVVVERPHHIKSVVADTYVATRLCISGVKLESYWLGLQVQERKHNYLPRPQELNDH